MVTFCNSSSISKLRSHTDSLAALVSATYSASVLDVHQQKYYPAFCASCASDAQDARTSTANQNATGLPQNASDATWRNTQSSGCNQMQPDATHNTQDATKCSTKSSEYRRLAKGPPFTHSWPRSQFLLQSSNYITSLLFYFKYMRSSHDPPHASTSLLLEPPPQKTANFWALMRQRRTLQH